MNINKSIKYYNLFIYTSFVISVITLSGWLFNLELLKRFGLNNQWLKMPPITAIVVIFCSIILWGFVKNKKLTILSYILSFSIIVIGLISLYYNYFLHKILIVNPFNLPPLIAQPLTAFAFIAFGIKLFLFISNRKNFQIVIEILAFISISVSFVLLISLTLGFSHLDSFVSFPKVSFQGTLCFLFIDLTILIVSPYRILFSPFIGNTKVALIAQRQITLIIIIVVLLGLIRIESQRSGYINTELGVGLMICCFILLCFFIIRSGIKVIVKKENERELEIKLKNESEQRFLDTLNRVSDGFIAIDSNWCYTYINEIAGVTMGKNPSDMIGKNIWEEFPETIGSAFHKLCFKAIETQEYQYIDDYYPPYKKWFESSFYPSHNGVSVFFKDVTRNKVAEQELIQTNQRFELLSKATNDALWELNIETGELWGNEIHQNLFGLSILDPVPTEVEWINRIHPNDKEQVEKLQKEMFNALDNFYSCEYRFLTNNGDYINIFDRAYVEKNEKGNPIRIVGNMMDITKIKNFEKKLEESKNHLKTILDNAPNCIKLLNSQGELLEMNDRGLDMVEASNIEILLNKPINSLIKEEYKASFSDMIKTVFKGESAKLQFEIIALKGTHKWFETNSVPLYNDVGDIVSMLGVTIDITESKKYENEILEINNRFNLISKATNDALWEANFITGVLWGNEVHQNLYGLTIKDPAPSEFEWLQKIHPDDRDNVYQNLQKNLNSNTNTFINEYRFLNSKNEYINIFSRAYIERDNNNKVIRILGTMMDVTSQKEASRKIADSYQAIRKLTEHLQKVRDEERTHIAREIHDELGQQLAVLKMDLFWLKKNAEQSIDERTQKVNDLLGLIDDMIKSVRKISFELRPISIDDLGLSNAFEQFLKGFEIKSGIKTNLIAPEDENINDSNIKNALYRIFQESLTNISRHSKATLVVVTLDITSEFIHLKIVDNGVGFNEIDVAQKKTLGIIGMKERAAILGGNYFINSKLDEGTIIEVKIPYKKN